MFVMCPGPVLTEQHCDERGRQARRDARRADRCEVASAQAPEGTSKTMLDTDQTTNNDEICQTDNPVSLNSSV